MSPPGTTNPAERVTEGIARCVAALEDLGRLRHELGELRKQTGQTAQFATALFDLERARRGDPDARTQLSEVADSLLGFWRERTGDALADSHPALGPMWAEASALLISFEVKRFNRALDACWAARGDAALLQEAIDGLRPAGNRRVDFAACLYHLELARLSVDSSRAEFARRAGLVHEAYHSREMAAELVGGDPGLEHLWKELVPYLDEFFEAVEAEQERKLRSNLKTNPGGEEAVAKAAPEFAGPGQDAEAGKAELIPVEERLEPLAPTGAEPIAVTFVGPSPTRRAALSDDAATEPNGKPLTEAIEIPARAPAPARPAGAAGTHPSGVFDLWLQDPNRPSAPPAPRRSLTPQPPPEALQPVNRTRSRPAAPPPNLTPASGTLEAGQLLGTPSARPPPPPSNFTPMPGTIEAPEDLPYPDVTAPRAQPPPPPSNQTPAPGRPTNESGILDLNDVIEEAPLSRPSLDVELGDYQPDEATQAFWRQTEAALGLLPAADAPRMDRRALSAEGRAERKKLNGWLDGVGRHFDTVPEARTFACLMKLYMAAQLKEKGLFGGANAKRKEAFLAALELLSAEPLAAGHVAVWFELDGKETLEHLQVGLEVLTDFLQYCARMNLDPLDPLAPAQFLT